MKNKQKNQNFQLNSDIKYSWSGKFVGKDHDWKHMERVLYDYELIVMEKGCLYIEDEWQRYEVSEGEYLLMKPTKCQRGFKPSKCSFYWMHFTSESDLGNQIFEEKQEKSIPVIGKLVSPERVFILLKQLQDTDLRYLDASYNTLLAKGILAELYHQTKNVLVEESEQDLVSKVSEYVVAHISDNLHVKDIAQAFGYNEKYFSTTFHKQASVGVKQFVDGIKMDRARYLLLNTNAWVAEIAQILGYENVQNFYHIFKKVTNTTPTEYRSTYGKKNEFDK